MYIIKVITNENVADLSTANKRYNGILKNAERINKIFSKTKPNGCCISYLSLFDCDDGIIIKEDDL